MTDSSDVLALVEWQNKMRSDPNIKSKMRSECGPALWNYANVMAKYTPPHEFISKFKSLVSTFCCSECSSKGLMLIDKMPFNPAKDNPQKYVCMVHNMVSTHINMDEGGNKPIYDCDIYCDTGELVESQIASVEALSNLQKLKVATETSPAKELEQPVASITPESTKPVATPSIQRIYIDPLQLFPIDIEVR